MFKTVAKKDSWEGSLTSKETSVMATSATLLCCDQMPRNSQHKGTV